MFSDRTASTLEAVAIVKRFHEVYCADQTLRLSLSRHGAATDISRWFGAGFPGADAFQPVWDRTLPSDLPLETWPLVAAWVGWRLEVRALRDEMCVMARSQISDRRLHDWRERQIARLAKELSAENFNALTHPVAAFELSSGCSLGCWFCGVSAARFSGSAKYADTADLWRDAVSALVDVAGPAARSGILYWGTDPCDNPDYPQFREDFVKLTGFLPATTTAASMRDTALTRRILEQARDHACGFERFSIVTPRQLSDVHAAYSPRELLDVELVIQTRDSLVPRTAAGRAREQARADTAPTTIACVSGFLINIPQRRVRLITPCRADSEHPDGMIVLGDLHFRDGAELLQALNTLIERHCTETDEQPEIPEKDLP